MFLGLFKDSFGVDQWWRGGKTRIANYADYSLSSFKVLIGRVED